VPFILKVDWLAARLAYLSLSTVPGGKISGLSAQSLVALVGSIHEVPMGAGGLVAAEEMIPVVMVWLLVRSQYGANGWTDRSRFRFPILEIVASSGENSWLSMSNASFLSMDLSMVDNDMPQADDYFTTNKMATTTFSYAEIVLPTRKLNQTHSQRIEEDE
jgi:hypothetical protein